MTARLMESRPARALDLDALRDAADEAINGQARRMASDPERVLSYLKLIQWDREEHIVAALASDKQDLAGCFIFKRINELAQEEAETEWGRGE